MEASAIKEDVNMNRESVLAGDLAALGRFRDFLLDRERASATVSKYLNDAKKLLAFLDGEREIDKQTLVDFKEWLWANYKPASCNSMIAGVNQFLESQGLGNLKLRLFRLQNVRMRPEERFMTGEEYRRLIGAAKKQGKPRLAMAMETLASTGARISELKYFTMDSIRHGQITVKNKGKIRTILLPAVLKKRLMVYAGQRKISAGCIFITASGRPVDRSNFWREMQQLCETAHVRKEKLFPHNLRHLFAHTYFRMTKDISGLADILGHSSLNVTRIYTMKTMEMQKKTLDMVGRAFIKKADRRSAHIQKY